MRKLFINLAFVVVLVSMLTIAYSCNSDSTVAPNYDQLTISGRITFTDTNGYYKFKDTTKGYYDISAFAKWPPTGPASANSKLVLKMDAGKMVADYQLLVANNSFYTLTSSYIKLPYTSGSVYGLGKYKSDTTHNPGIIYDTTNARVSVSGVQTIGNINFLSWIDTTSKIYRF
ncbi:MAG: hypothetical protein NTY74_06895 [Ignavibacteriae bacterium]|nr:hypothetical protein [Ignavibacteriota bacterium]